MIRLLLALAVLSAVWTAPAAAQLSSGISGQSSAPVQGVPKDYWIMIRKLGLCTADRKPELSHAFLATEPGTSEEKAAFDALFNKRGNMCMGRYASGTLLIAHFRGSLAEAFVQMADDEHRAAVLAGPLPAPEIVGSLKQFAQCYLAARPSESWVLLRDTKVGFGEELEAMRELAPGFAECLPSDREVSLSPVAIRMSLAEAMYQALNAPTLAVGKSD